ncbi:sugar transferase [Neobacillus cucumis]|uniref:sugar transferase n=1 Tax=Neobacillus cucumis TaxID=1740721 RepID=UPI002852F9AA|nr:sugar transferase [Neobacillus cucumis]MDR4949912.1 sugar transferase [Neobacillus cucumis]
MRDKKIYQITKRLIDIIGSIVGIMLILPTLLVIMTFYFYGSNKGPIFFKQIRVGQNGKEFYIYKFRSMVVDAEKRLKENKELYDRYIKNNFKLEPHEDPRVTPFGRFIRKTSLDELPQFINVLKGEMSLVGPRPVVLEELSEYKNKKAEFLSVKPGITGYWQVCGRSDVGYPERVDIELFYVYNKSLFLDIKIIFKTAVQVLIRKGAY